MPSHFQFQIVGFGLNTANQLDNSVRTEAVLGT